MVSLRSAKDSITRMKKPWPEIKEERDTDLQAYVSYNRKILKDENGSKPELPSRLLFQEWFSWSCWAVSSKARCLWVKTWSVSFFLRGTAHLLSNPVLHITKAAECLKLNMSRQLTSLPINAWEPICPKYLGKEQCQTEEGYSWPKIRDRRQKIRSSDRRPGHGIYKYEWRWLRTQVNQIDGCVWQRCCGRSKGLLGQ